MRMPDTTRPADRRTKRITLVGCGNIGSPAALLLGKLPMVSQLQIIDADIFSASNLMSQAIGVRDVGRPKATSLARRLQPMCPGVEIDAVPRWIENVPLGWLRGDVIVACVDSRRARCVINEMAWRLGIPWIDSGVDAGDLLARAMVYRPGLEEPCFLCNFTAADFAAMEQHYPCLSGGGAVAPTRAPASLGSIAAGLVATECQLLLSGALRDEAYGRQVLWDIRHHRCLDTSYRVNPQCRFDHATWQIETLSLPRPTISLSDFFDSLRHQLAAEPQTIQVAGQSFALRLVCPACGLRRDRCIYLSRALTANRVRCRACGGVMIATGFEIVDWLSPNKLGAQRLRRSLSSIGLAAGDVLAVRTASGCRHVELVREPDARVGESATRSALAAAQDLPCSDPIVLPGGKSDG